MKKIKKESKVLTNEFLKPLTEKQKPTTKLIGQNGNVFNLMAICNKSLIKANLDCYAKEMISRIKKCGSYSEALCLMMEYIDIT